MNYEDFKIDDGTAEKIAISIFKDIAPYLKLHQEDFEKWKNERNDDNGRKIC